MNTFLTNILDNKEKLSAVISLTVALMIVLASFFQWWDLTWGGMRTRLWVKIMLLVCVILLIVTIILIIL